MYFSPLGYISIPDACGMLNRWVYGDAFWDKPIPFYHDEARDGRTVRVDTPEDAKRVKSEAREASAQCRDIFLHALATGALTAEADDAKGHRRAVPRSYWEAGHGWTLHHGYLEKTATYDLPMEFNQRGCFIREKDFTKWLRTLTRVTGAARQDCKRWIEDLARKGGPSPGKEILWAKAQEEFGSRLNKAQFLRAWREAAPKGWRKSGRPRRNKIDS